MTKYHHLLRPARSWIELPPQGVIEIDLHTWAGEKLAEQRAPGVRIRRLPKRHVKEPIQLIVGHLIDVCLRVYFGWRRRIWKIIFAGIDDDPYIVQSFVFGANNSVCLAPALLGVIEYEH